MTYALDTSTIIRLLRNDTAVCINRNKALENGAGLVIPIVADYETQRGFHYQPSRVKERLYQLLCSQYPIIDLSKDVWNHATKLYADLRRKGYTIGDADILIASLCIVGEYVLVSTNTKHFEAIDGLQLVNWAE